VLKIFHSSDYAWLRAQLIAGESAALSHAQDPFERTTIWLASNADEWELRRGFADTLGIAANLDFAPLAEGLWATANELLGLNSRSPFSAQSLKPLIFEVFEERALSKAKLWNWLPPLQSQRLVVAAKTAEYFSRYVTYRQASLAHWGKDKTKDEADGATKEETKDESWQKDLWLALGKKLPQIAKQHPFELLEKLPRQAGGSSSISSLKRFHLFNPVTIAPLYERALLALSKTCDVFVYFLNPSPLNWHDRSDDLPRLLAALGAERRYSFERISDWVATGNASEFVHYEEPIVEPSAEPTVEPSAEPASSFLAFMRAQVFSLSSTELKVGVIADEMPLTADLMVHSCAGIAEQLIVVKKRIEALLLGSPNFRLSDALVLLPRNANYQEAVKLLPWVWQDGLVNPLPYRLAGVAQVVEDPLIDAWLQMLALLESGFEIDVMMRWLGSPAVLKRLDISEADLDRLQSWLLASGVRRHLESDTGHSWAQAIEWLFLRYCSEPDNADPNDLMLFGLDLELLGKLVKELTDFQRATGPLLAVKDCAGWVSYFQECFDSLVYYPDCDIESAAVVRELIASLSVLDSIAQFDFETAKTWLLSDNSASEYLSQRATLQRSSTLTVAPLGALRGQRFKHIFILGLEQIPLIVAGEQQDLMVHSPARGDPSTRESDLCAVLDAILAAQSCVELTYLGKDPTTKAPLAEPMLIALLERCAQDVGLRLNKHAGVDDDAVAFVAPVNAPLPQRSLQITEVMVENQDEKISRLLDLTNPLAHYLKRHLGLRIFDDSQELDAQEPFELSGIDLWRRRADLLESPKAALRRSLPQANFGRLTALRADTDVNFCRVIEQSFGAGTLIEVTPSEIRWSGIIRSLIDYALGDTAGKTRIVICQSKAIRVGERQGENDVPEVSVANRLAEVLDAMRTQFIEAPFVFGRDIATDFFTKLYAPTKEHPRRFWQMSQGEAQAFVGGIFAKLAWNAPDGTHAHDLLWHNQPNLDMPELMQVWLEQLAMQLHSLGLPVYIHDSVSLLEWVAPVGATAEGEEDE
jgi:exonuclease V gamma subunit